MGLYASADLVYGVRVNAYENDTPHPLWDEDEGDWRDLERNEHIELHYFGHYENSDDPKVIVRVKSTPKFSGDCWEPGGGFFMLLGPTRTALIDANDEAKGQGYYLDFLNDAKWWLVASYG